MCTITITSSSVFKVGNELRVSGTVEGCEPDFDTGSIVQVDFECNGNVTSDTPDVDGSGFWYASVPAGDCDCAAENAPPQMVTVTVSCFVPSDEESCQPLTQTLPLLCVSNCIVTTNAPGEDDVFDTEIEWVCEDGPNAVVTFKFWVRNDLPFDVFIRVENPVLVSLMPSAPPLVPVGATQQIEIQARVPTPLTSPNDIFTFYYVDNADAVVPCPGFSETVVIEISCCPPNEAPRIQVDTDGCTVTASWDSTLVPDDCYLQFDFKDPSNPSPQYSSPGDSSKTYDYSSDGLYEDLSAYVKCSNGCSGSPVIFGPVNIVGCASEPPPPDNPPTHPTEPESALCGASRIVAVVTGAMAIFLLAAAWCLDSVHLAKGAAILAVISAILWGFYYLFNCEAPCGVGKLSAAETSIAAGLALLTYSACCKPQFVSAGAALLLTGLTLFYKWKDECNYSNCHAWAELAGLGATVTTYLIWILDQFSGMSACKAAIISWQGVDVNGSHIVQLITAITVYKLKDCFQGSAPEDQPTTMD